MSWKIATAQLQDIQGNTPSALKVITEKMQEADKQHVDILCFPECFLQGYTLDERETEERAIDLKLPTFEDILKELEQYNVTIILGLIEKDGDGLYNTAAVIRQGKLLGKYRKVHLFEPNFWPGEVYPVFSVDGLTLGINICYDARFTEGAAELSAQGAKVIFYPLNNRLPKEKAINYRDKHVPNLIDRAKESGCWVVSSDVVAQDETHTGYGCTAIVDTQGKVVSQIEELEVGMLAFEIL